MDSKINSPVLPHRFSEKAFRKYEKIIAHVVQRYPLVTELDPASLGLSPETIRGRLRDAWTSYTDHSWPSQLVNREKFTSIIPHELSICIIPSGKVIAGPKTAIKNYVTPADIPEPLDIISDDEIYDGTLFGYNEVFVLCQLAHHGVLKKRIRVKLTSSEAADLLDHFDIALDLQPNLTFLLS